MIRVFSIAILFAISITGSLSAQLAFDDGGTHEVDYEVQENILIDRQTTVDFIEGSKFRQGVNVRDSASVANVHGGRGFGIVSAGTTNVYGGEIGRAGYGTSIQGGIANVYGGTVWGGSNWVSNEIFSPAINVEEANIFGGLVRTTADHNYNPNLTAGAVATKLNVFGGTISSRRQRTGGICTGVLATEVNMFGGTIDAFGEHATYGIDFQNGGGSLRMKGGAIFGRGKFVESMGLRLWNGSEALIYDGTIQGSYADLSGQPIGAHVKNAHMEIHGGRVIGEFGYGIIASDQSTVEIRGGSIVSSTPNTYHDAPNLAALLAEGDSQVEISGGNLVAEPFDFDRVDLAAKDDAIVKIFGINFDDREEGEVVDSEGTIKGTLRDGTEFEWSFTKSNNARILLSISAVPEPSSAALIGWILIVGSGYRRKRNEISLGA